MLLAVTHCAVDLALAGHLSYIGKGRATHALATHRGSGTESGEAGRIADLRGRRADGRADTGDEDAASELAGLLADCGDLDGLRALVADFGDEDAGSRLAGLLVSLLIKEGRVEEAEWLRRFGLNPDASIACA